LDRAYIEKTKFDERMNRMAAINSTFAEGGVLAPQTVL
jgi:hypothetical protein